MSKVPAIETMGNFETRSPSAAWAGLSRFNLNFKFTHVNPTRFLGCTYNLAKGQDLQVIL